MTKKILHGTIAINSNINVLITGGNGTIGKFLKETLSYNIFAPSRNELDLASADAVSKYFDENKIDTVIHCALTGRNDLFSKDPAFTTDSLWMFRNLWNNRHKFNKLINLGTAYELDLEQNNENIIETEFLNHLPSTSYGYAKNIITRIIHETDKFYNLRLFGVFHEHEADNRFFKKLYLNKGIEINNDIYLDYIYLGDVVPVINEIIENKVIYKDINMVYSHKFKLSELANVFCIINNIDPTNVVISGSKGNNLTGNSSRLEALNLRMLGLRRALALYQR